MTVASVTRALEDSPKPRTPLNIFSMSSSMAAKLHEMGSSKKRACVPEYLGIVCLTNDANAKSSQDVSSAVVNKLDTYL